MAYRFSLSRRGRLKLGCFVFLLSLVAAGCSPGQGDLSGKVYYKEKLLGYGSVVLYDSDGKPMTAGISDKGEYSFTGVRAGEVRLAVVSIDPKSKKELIGRKKKGPEDGQLPGDPDLWFEIPAQYNDVNTSDLTATVNRGENPHDIKMQ
jgi:hypothetical protein